MVDRALILFEQSRYDLAERELRRELTANPDSAVAHALLAMCLAERKQFEEAGREAKEAVRLSPDLPFAHYALAGVLQDRGRLDEAKTAIEEAIRLNPSKADYFALLANVEINRERWKEALAAAEQGLALDPENVECANMRAIAQVKLGRKRDARSTLKSALAKDPENALTHANQGWTLLHQADHAGALVEFREALRINPNLEWAQRGIVEALKARYFVYGLMLRYFLWMSRLNQGTRWAVIIGGYFGYRVLRDVVRANPSLGPWIWPLLGLYGLFVLLTWVSDPLFNLVLRLNRFGRLALSKEQVTASNYVGACLLAAVLAAVAWLITGREVGILVAIVFGLLVIPVSGTFHCQPGWPRKAMALYTGFVAVLGLAGAAVSFVESGNAVGTGLFAISLLGAVLSTWAANFMIAARPKR